MLTSVPFSLRYDVALLYLNNADWDLDAAIDAYRDDEQWETDHPLETKQQAKKGKSASSVGRRRFLGSISSAR